jgi:hypothetical protein
MGRSPDIAIVSALVLLLSGCSDDTIGMIRPDSGAPLRDGGSDDPLDLRAGMTFAYRAILTYRDAALGAERNSQYELTLVIDSVDDNGAAEESTLRFHASTWNTIDDDWSATADFDSWVARLGPAKNDDQVNMEPVTARLWQVPAIPPAPMPAKQLPDAGTFFLDLRRVDALRADFASTYGGRNPQVVDPAMNAGSWRFALSGRDESIFYYPDRAKTRQVFLHYDPIGFLRRLEESIGDAATPPSATCRLELMSGP